MVGNPFGLGRVGGNRSTVPIWICAHLLKGDEVGRGLLGENFKEVTSEGGIQLGEDMIFDEILVVVVGVGDRVLERRLEGLIRA